MDLVFAIYYIVYFEPNRPASVYSTLASFLLVSPLRALSHLLLLLRSSYLYVRPVDRAGNKYSTTYCIIKSVHQQIHFIMAEENIEVVSTKVLLKRKKFITFLGGVFIGVGLFLVGVIIYDFSQDKEMSQSTISGAVVSLVGFCLPFFMLGRVNSELKRRRQTEDTKT